MMKKRILLTAIAAALIVTVFAGCGGSSEPSPSASPTPTSTASASPTVSPSASPEGETEDGTEESTPTPDGTQSSATPAPEKPSTGSGSGSQNAATATPRPNTPAPATPAPATPAPATPAPSISVSDLMSRMIGALPSGSHTMSAIPSDLYAGVYQIDPSAYEDVLVYGETMNVKANEIIVIKAKDSANLSEAVAALNNRLAALEQQWKNYLPDQYELVKAGTVTTKGLYATLVIAQGGQSAVAAFNSAAN